VLATLGAALLLLFQPGWLELLGWEWLLELWRESAPDSELGPVDKAAHLVVFGTLQWMWLAATRELSGLRRLTTTVGLLVFLYSFGLELLQRLTPDRGFELSDLGANALGIGVASMLYLLRARRSRAKLGRT
jgi:hypothetical protein